jgi:sugar phosphate isomerase/epimerase
MRPAATTTAWGDADPLDVVLQRIADHDLAVDLVELSIGARHIPNGPDVIADWSDRFTFIAHHTAPVGPGMSLRPSLNASPDAAARLLNELGIRRYTGHPPNRRDTDVDEMLTWAQTWFETLAAAGISWSVETMYVPRTRDEAETSGGYHLSTPAEVWSFVEWASSVGWDDPLLIDASHLHIGWCGGQWTEVDIVRLLADAPCTELHISTNDGRRDLHSPLMRDDLIWGWVAPHLERFDIVVDEGRRRRSYDIPHVAA